MVHKVVWQKSIPAQIRLRILYISNSEGQVDGFAEQLTFAKRLKKNFVRDKRGFGPLRRASGTEGGAG